MAEGRAGADWTAALYALTFNINRDPKKSKPLTIADVNPYAKKEKPMQVPITALRDVFLPKQP